MALACNFITRWLLLRVYIHDISLNLLNVLIPLLRNLLMRPYKSVGGGTNMYTSSLEARV